MKPDKEDFLRRLDALAGMLLAHLQDCDGQTGEATVNMVWGMMDYMALIKKDAEALLS